MAGVVEQQKGKGWGVVGDGSGSGSAMSTPGVTWLTWGVGRVQWGATVCGGSRIVQWVH